MNRMMDCENIQREILASDWTLESLRRASELHEHLQNCESCRETIADYDKIRNVLRIDHEPKVDDRPLLESSTEPGGAVVNRSLMASSGWLAAAAVLVVALILGRSQDAGVPTANQPASPPVELAKAPSTTEIEESLNLFRQLATDLEGRTGWVALGAGLSDVGVSDEPIVDGDVLVLRLVMSRDQSQVSTADIVIRPGQRADVSLPLADGRELHYRINAAEGEQLAIEAVLRGGAASPIGSLTTHVEPEDGRLLDAGRLVTRDGVFDLAFALTATPWRSGT